MPQHKNPQDLKRGDKFAMAGVHYEILDVYETVDPEMTKVQFAAFGPNWYDARRNTMTLHNDLLMILL